MPGEQTELSLLDNFERFRVHAFKCDSRDRYPGNFGHLIDVRNVVGGATVLAGDGNDTVVGSLTNDVLSGGPGDDTIDYTPRDHAMNIAIQFADNDGAIETSRMLSSFGGVQERDELRDFEAVLGSQGNDTILAGGHDGFSVRVDGSGGDDFLTVAEERSARRHLRPMQQPCGRKRE